MPRRLQVEFSGIVQRHTDALGSEVSAADLWQLFGATYLVADGAVRYREHHLFEKGKAQGIRLAIDLDGMPCVLTGEGNGPIDAAVHALRGAGIEVQVRSYEERSMAASSDGGNARALAVLEIVVQGREWHGVGIDDNIVTASIKAIVSALSRSRACAANGETVPQSA
jgi:2-isopropylmalate synthase